MAGIERRVQDDSRSSDTKAERLTSIRLTAKGCEFYSYKDWIQMDLRQILVEVHQTPSMVNEFFQDIHDANICDVPQHM